MAADVKLIKVALEDAKFDDPVVREKIFAAINSLSDDLVEVNFSASITTDQIFDDLEEYLDEGEVSTDDDEEEDDEEEEEEEEDDEDDEDDDDDDIVFDTDEDEDKES